MTGEEMILSAVGAASDPNSCGRQMPSHWGHKTLNVVSTSSPTGTQFLQAVGSAEAVLRAKQLGVTEGFEKDEVVLCTTGDGTTSEGEFWESLNNAANLKLPVVYRVAVVFHEIDDRTLEVRRVVQRLPELAFARRAVAGRDEHDLVLLEALGDSELFRTHHRFGGPDRLQELRAGRRRAGHDVVLLVSPVARHLAAARVRVICRANRRKQHLLG